MTFWVWPIYLIYDLFIFCPVVYSTSVALKIIQTGWPNNANELNCQKTGKLLMSHYKTYTVFFLHILSLRILRCRSVSRFETLSHYHMLTNQSMTSKQTWTTTVHCLFTCDTVHSPHAIHDVDLYIFRSPGLRLDFIHPITRDKTNLRLEHLYWALIRHNL